MDDPVLVNVVEHLVHERRDDLFRTAGDSEGDGGGVEIAGKNFGGENGFLLEEVPFAFVLYQGDEVSDEKWDTSGR